ncbi:hypothetical protein D9758_014784 [Tetrapyrgos nigripes]|uniref:Alpha-type protein kinase domain-containing protein n=1 Tax=Tetrapyrgos nigripes TaxID=182062 RepID=A0A8H5C5R0_9AGAR|nr:hypothetical protein D9758_014784 [Tetrapyrgos nigripes]
MNWVGSQTMAPCVYSKKWWFLLFMDEGSTGSEDDKETEEGSFVVVVLLDLICNIHGKASPASGVDDQDIFLNKMPDNDNETAGSVDQNIWSVAWLLEKKCSKSYTKWSSTNIHPSNNKNKVGNVLNAFAHFFYQESQKTMVIADLQTSTLGNKKVLFDMMFHTEDGGSGVGDHGEQGITIFLTAHECIEGGRCELLELDSLTELD